MACALFVTSVAGFKGGLQLELNVEQYEYMPGPNDGAGIKVLVHHPKEAPLMEEFGMAVPPGTHAYIGITMVEVRLMPINCFYPKNGYVSC